MLLGGNMSLIVLDKSVLRGCGKTALRGFFATHTAIMPHTLLFEISSAGEEKGRSGLPLWPSYYDKMKSLLENGYFGQNASEIVAEEFRTGSPVKDVIDHKLTRAERAGGLRTSLGIWTNPRQWWSEDYKKALEDETVATLKSYTRLITVDGAETIGRIRRECIGLRQDWVEKLARAVCEQCRIAWPKHYPEAPSLGRPDSFKFIEYVLINLLNVSRAIVAREGEEESARLDHLLFNDWMDAHYLCFLVRAEGILSSDENMCRLAKALFEDREVWFYRQEKKDFVRFGEQM
jgi:hypothetical protein